MSQIKDIKGILLTGVEVISYSYTKNKEAYCNIPIIRIPYNKNFGIEDLILETSRFILTKENKNEYYKY